MEKTLSEMDGNFAVAGIMKAMRTAMTDCVEQRTSK